MNRAYRLRATRNYCWHLHSNRCS